VTRSNLNVLLIGGGFMGKAHSLAYATAPIATDLGLSVTRKVLVDNNAEIAVAAAAQLGWEESATDWRAAVTRDDIDIVDICTPPHMHREIAMAAMAAGKHVFCEKPLSNDVAEATEMADAAQAAGVVTQVGFNYRHTPAVVFTKKLLDEGRLGVPLQFRASYLQETGFLATDPNRWRARKSTGGSGAAGDIGSHIIEIAEYLLGDIVSVSALLRSKAPGYGTGWAEESVRLGDDLIDDGGVWLARFANGTIGTFACNTFALGRKNRVYFELDVTRAATQFDWNEREEFRVAYNDEEPDHRGFRVIHTGPEHPGGWWKLAGLGTGYVEVSALQFQAFLSAIASGTQTSPSFVEALHVQRVIDAVTRSAEGGQWIDVQS